MLGRDVTRTIEAPDPTCTMMFQRSSDDQSPELTFLDDPDSEASWESFVGLCMATIDRAAGRATADEELAREIAAEVLERFHADWPELLRRFLSAAHRSNFRVWLAVVARHSAIDRLRARRGRKAVPRSIARLPKWQQSLWRLTTLENRPLSEAAESLEREGLWNGTVDALATTLSELQAKLPEHVLSPVAQSGQTGAETIAPESEVADVRSPSASSPEAQADKTDVHRTWSVLLQDLSPDERFLVRVYFLEGTTARGVAVATGMTQPQKVYDRVKVTLQKLRTAAEASGLDASDLAQLSDFDWHTALAEGGS